MWTAILVPWDFVAGRGATFQHREMAWQLAGWWAFRDASWHLPLLYVDSLNAPEGISVVFLDIIPLAAIVFKTFSAFLPRSFHYYGIWHVVAFVAQATSAVFLIRSLGHRGVAVAALTAILAVTFPALTYRFGHTALLSQGCLLVGLALYYRCVSGTASTRASLAWFGLLLLVTLLVHAYLFAMASAIYGALLIDRWRTAPRRVRTELLAGAGATGAAVALTLALLGYSGASGGAGGFGLYSMNALAPFSKSLTLINATGGQYEGFNYLGAGVLLGLALTLYRDRHWIGQLLSRFRGLAWTFAGLTLLALSNRIYIGEFKLVSTSLPPAVESMVGVLRASGRMFWPVGYALLFLAIAGTLRIRQRTVAVSVLTALTAVQVVDVFEVTAPMRAMSREPALDHQAYERLIGRTERVMFYPIFDCQASDWELLRVLQPIAARAGKPINTVVAARTSADCESKADAFFEAPAAGTLYVAYRNAALLAPRFRPLIDAGACRQRDEAVFCVPGADAAWWAPLEPQMAAVSLDVLPVLAPGQILDFTTPKAFPAGALTGFGAPGEFGSWMVGRRSAVYFRAGEAGADDRLSLVMSFSSLIVPGKQDTVRFDVLVDQRVVGTYAVSDAKVQELVIDLAAGTPRAPSAVVEVGLRMHRPLSPVSMGAGRDTRLLGLLIRTLRIVPTAPG